MTGDHTTSVYTGEHSFESVPFAVATAYACVDGSEPNKGEQKEIKEWQKALRDELCDDV